MKRVSLFIWWVPLGISCAIQETQPEVIPDIEAATSNAPAVAERLRDDVEILPFDPGLLPTDEVDDPNDDQSCSGRISSFTWNSADFEPEASNREIISVNGTLSGEDLHLEMSWIRGAGEDRLEKEWQSIEMGESYAHWQALLSLPLAERGVRRLRGASAHQLTVMHESDGDEVCVRSGVPIETRPWVTLNEHILSQIDREEPSFSRSQLVLALENAPDIRSVELVCIGGWQERTGVRNGRARFEDVPRESCQAGWVGDRRGWVELPAASELFRCVFETENVICDPL